MNEQQPRFAFFDVDDTLIAIKSMFDFFPFWCARTGQSGEMKRFEEAFSKARAAGASREKLNHLYYRFFQGADLVQLETVATEWFSDRFEANPAPFFKRVTDRLEAHRVGGVHPVFISGSMLPLLAPIASELQVAHILCTKLIIDDLGRLTGEIGAPQTIGDGKAVAIRQFLANHHAAPAECFAYGDDISDIAMLEAVGNSVAVGSHPELLRISRQRGWAQLAV